MTAIDTIWKFAGPQVTSDHETTGVFCTVGDLTLLNWRWLSCTALSDGSPLLDQIEIAVSFEPSLTGLRVPNPDAVQKVRCAMCEYFALSGQRERVKEGYVKSHGGG